MNHLGEILSLIVAVSWTFSAWYADKASRRIGSMETNVIRLVLATLFLSILLWVTIGRPFPVHADWKAWLWLGLSAVVGYVFGDYCLFNSYLLIGPRLGQLMMTIVPPMAAIAGWIMLGESMSWKSILAMAVTLCGIGMSILSRGEKHQLKLDIPFKGILLGIGAGTGQGVGLVLSKIGGSKRLDVSRIAIVEFHHPTKQGCAHTVLTIEELHIGHLEQGIGVIGIYVQAMLEQVMGLTEIACQLLLNAFLIEIRKPTRIGRRQQRPLHGFLHHLLATSLRRKSQYE